MCTNHLKLVDYKFTSEVLAELTSMYHIPYLNEVNLITYLCMRAARVFIFTFHTNTIISDI